jgi:hypothetical protein
VELAGSNVDGPWMVVKKQKRARKAKEKEATAAEEGGRKGPTRVNANGNNSGSRFESLTAEDTEDLLENITEPIRDSHVAEEREGDGKKKQKKKCVVNVQQKEGAGKKDSNYAAIIDNNGGGADFNKKDENDKIIGQKRNIPELNEGREDNMSQPIIVTTNQERHAKTRLATRGAGNFKGKSNGKFSNSMRSTKETLGNLQGVQQMEEFFAAHFNEVSINGRLFQHTQLGPQMGLKDSTKPNIGRPPDSVNSPPPNNNSHMQNMGEIVQEGVEEFIDAVDQGLTGSLDSDMEEIQETPEIAQ